MLQGGCWENSWPIATYLIDEQGIIVKIFTDVDVSSQVDPIIEAFKESGKL